MLGHGEVVRADVAVVEDGVALDELRGEVFQRREQFNDLCEYPEKEL